MTRQIRLNAFDMNCVGHQSPGLWAHPRDRSWQYKDLEYWTDLVVLVIGIVGFALDGAARGLHWAWRQV